MADGAIRLRRIDGWDVKLATLLQDYQARPFAWGSHDCCLLACDAVDTITGVDLAADFRGRYTSKIGAIQTLRALGYESIWHLCNAKAKVHQIGRIEANRAQRGDLGYCKSNGGSLCVWGGGGWHTMFPKSGFGVVAPDRIVQAWRIG